jgi:hypothetical protein
MVTRTEAKRAYRQTRRINAFWQAVTGQHRGYFALWFGGYGGFWVNVVRCPRDRLRDPDLRQKLLATYSHTITDPLTIAVLRKYARKRVCSIGAGTGWLEYLISHRTWWQRLLLLHRVHVVAFDIAPPDIAVNEYHGESLAGTWQPTRTFYPIHLGGPEQVSLYPDHTLLLAWPCPGPFALQALLACKSDRVIIVGDPRYNADHGFWEEISKNWVIEALEPPIRWECLDVMDWVIVLRRRAPD